MLFKNQLYKIVFPLLQLIVFVSCNNNSNPNTLFQLKSVDETGIHFKNTITENDSINFVKNFYVYNGAGVATADFNNDGLMDIYFTANIESGALYVNRGGLKFNDVTEEANCKTIGWCTGVSAVDINNDGLMDIYISRAGNSNPLLRENLLFINKGINKNGIPRFEELAKQYGINDNGYTTQAAFLDYDKDGDLDLFLLNHSLEKHNPNEITPFKKDGTGLSVSVLYRNDSSLFTNVSKDAGILFDGMGLGVAVNDFNMDGWPDIYISNDFLAHDFLYVNNSNGTFTEKGEEYFKHYSQFSMGTDAADINNDGWPDIVTVDMLPFENYRRQMMPGPMNYNQYNMALSAGYQPQFMRNTLQVSNGMNADGKVTYSEVGQFSGIDATDWSWAPLFADFDNDGLKDLFISNGYKRFVINMDFIVYHIGKDGKPEKDWNEASKIDKSLDMPGIDVHNFIYRNKDGLQFEDKSMDWGFNKTSFSNGAAYADFDNDGDLDLITSNVDAPAFLYENKANQKLKNNFLAVALNGPAGNKNGEGAKLWLYSNGAMQYQFQSTVKGYQSTVDNRLHFGLHKNTVADSLIIEWPDGKVQKLLNVKTNQLIKLNYAEASVNNRLIPYTSLPVNTLYKDISATAGINFRDTQSVFHDFNIQYLLPHKLSEQGPKLATADVNGDKLEDVFIGGGAGVPGEIFIQQKSGVFIKSSIISKEKKYEDVDAVFFDADKDGDADLYVVSGSNETRDADLYQDRLYTNDGKGKFTLGKEALPNTVYSGGCVAVADYDKDGDLDIFRGARLVAAQYPLSPNSSLFENVNGKFTDVTANKAPQLEDLGMITGAVWTDFNNDNQTDLVVVGEFMPPTFFENKNGKLTNITASTGTANATGWWNCIKAADIDGDGDIDFIAGNLGLNSRLKAGEKEPITIYANDYNNDNFVDPVMTYYIQGEEHLLPLRDQFIEQIRSAYKIFPYYNNYAQAKVSTVLKQKDLQGALILKATTFASCIIENLGNGKFKCKALPAAAQLAPVTAILVDDVNNDKYPDMILVGNDYSSDVVTGRYDAFTGAVLLNDRKGNFKFMPHWQTGFFVDGDVKSISLINTVKGKTILVSERNKGIKIFIY